MSEPAPAVTTVEIDGYRYTLSPLPAWQSLETFQTVAKIAGPAFAQLGKLAAGGGESLELDGAAAASALTGLGDAVAKTLHQVPPAEVRALVARLLTGCLVFIPETSKEAPLMPLFDVHFQRRLLSLFKLVGHAVDLNYSDFSAGLKLLVGKLAAKMATGEKSPPSVAPVIESKISG